VPRELVKPEEMTRDIKVECPPIISTDLDGLRLLGEWREVSRKPFSYRQLEEVMPWATFWQLNRNGSSPTASDAGPSLREAIPTMLRGRQSLNIAAYWSLI
jgi:hypothetical protein